MELKELVFDSGDPFDILSVYQNQRQVSIVVQSKQSGCICPLCSLYSESVHSGYTRKFKDIPALDNAVQLQLRSRKFYCRNPDCERKVFTERFTDHFMSYKRMTSRLENKLLKVALLTGGNAGEKLCKTLNIEVSSSTLIRLVHNKPLPEITHPVAIGIDDWAYKKGTRYGTAIVDLEKREIIDLLPDREAITVQNWLSNHKNIQVITRDRFAQYASATRNVFPEATHVADRFHLLQNLSDSLKRLLQRNYSVLKQAEFKKYDKPVQTLKAERGIAQQRFIHLKRLQKRGKSATYIAELLHMDIRSVNHYFMLDNLPQKVGTKRNDLKRFEPQIAEWVMGDPGINLQQLYLKLKEQGSRSSYVTVYRELNHFIENKVFVQKPVLSKYYWPASTTSILLCKKKSSLSNEEQQYIANICSKSPAITRAVELARIFREMMEVRNGRHLYLWIDLVTKETLDIKELKNFANGMINDYKAIANALSLPYSNAQVEGQINKLKMIKRQMYGRGSFDFLRKRLLLNYSVFHQN